MYRRPGRLTWYCSFSDDEKHISLGTTDEDEAKAAFAAHLERRRIRGMAPGEAEISKLFATARERAETNCTTKTAYEFHLNLSRILKWLEQRGVYSARAVTREVVEDYKTSRRFARQRGRADATKGVSAARINRELDSWRKSVQVAIDDGLLHKGSLDAFVKLREPRPEPHRQVHSRAQIERFLRAVPLPYRYLFRAMLGCGLRDEELRQLRERDVRAGEVVVTPHDGWTTKGYRYRRVPISAATRKAIAAWLKARGSVSCDPKRVWSIAVAASTAAKVPRITAHVLRHSWASHLYHEGVPLKTLSMWLGHREVATTERYLGVVEAGLPAGLKLPW